MNIHIETDENRTILGLVMLVDCGVKSLKDLKVYLNNGGDINHVDDGGYNALIWSAVRGRLDTCKFLVENGINIYQKTESGENVLSRALDNGQLHIYYYLLRKFINMDKFFNCKRKNIKFKNIILID